MCRTPPHGPRRRARRLLARPAATAARGGFISRRGSSGGVACVWKVRRARVVVGVCRTHTEPVTKAGAVVCSLNKDKFGVTCENRVCGAVAADYRTPLQRELACGDRVVLLRSSVVRIACLHMPRSASENSIFCCCVFMNTGVSRLVCS